ncbi:hypothetical protein ABB55_21465 [Prosthecomicrobium hirschii]|uniref:Uncharacterized protein n=1 Tax=Prosthecodimorpha hirschii TaxID=665126 RepID=A0A0P6WD98_9HYPH|nr:hypothetical protein [Prosthecomicrobium hirschii]KPL54469.1 hypothetical protein ABB55_21465 [Prosthecomicrobium hirschii]
MPNRVRRDQDRRAPPSVPAPWTRHGRPDLPPPAARRQLSGRRVLGAIAAGCALLGLAGCKLTEETGFVELRRQYAQTGAGIYRLDGEEVPGLANPTATASAIVRRRTGTVTLDFFRADRAYELCRFPLAKNRIVTVTLTLEGREIKCRVEA